MARGISQDDLDRLFTAALEAAVARVEKDGSFQPLVFELRDTGAVQAVMMLDKEHIDGPEAARERLMSLLRPRVAEGRVRAAAIAEKEGRDIVVRLRAANYSADVTAPVALATSGIVRRKREATLGEFSQVQVPNDLFGEA